MVINFKKSLVSPTQAEKLEELLTHGWGYIHAYLSSVPKQEKSLPLLEALTAMELRGKNRHYVVHRLYRCFAEVRKSCEEKLLYER